MYSHVLRPWARLRITLFHTWSITTIMPNVRSSPVRPLTSNTVNRLPRSTFVCPFWASPTEGTLHYRVSHSAASPNLYVIVIHEVLSMNHCVVEKRL